MSPFDTSGMVKMRPTAAPQPWRPGHWWWSWSDLDPFTQGYVEALFASGRHPDDPYTGYGLRRPVLAGKAATSSIIGWMPLGFSDLAAETLARIMEDCAAFLTPAAHAGCSDSAEVGADFWRGRSGVVWEREGFPPLTPTLGEDGKIYLR